MNRRKQLLGGPADDRGAALLMVLVIVTVIGLAGAARRTFSAPSSPHPAATLDQRVAWEAPRSGGPGRAARAFLGFDPARTHPQRSEPNHE